MTMKCPNCGADHSHLTVVASGIRVACDVSKSGRIKVKDYYGPDELEFQIFELDSDLLELHCDKCGEEYNVVWASKTGTDIEIINED